MKLVSFQPAKNITRLGIYLNDTIYDLAIARSLSTLTFTLPFLPDAILSFLELGNAAMNDASILHQDIIIDPSKFNTSAYALYKV